MSLFGDISGSSIYDGSYASNPITVTAYEAAKAGGYTGTFAEYCAAMAGLAGVYDDPDLINNLIEVKSIIMTDLTLQTIIPTWEQGNIAVSNGADQNSGNAYYVKRCRTSGYLSFADAFGEKLMMDIADGYALSIREYADNAGTYNESIPVGGNVYTGITETTIQPNSYYRFALRLESDANFNYTDIPYGSIKFSYLKSAEPAVSFLNKIIEAFT